MLNMRMIAGKVLMDRHAPAALTDTAKSGYDQSKALIAKWHGRGRQLYAVTPRFAASSTPEQMHMAAQLWAEHPGTWLQSHVSENRAEMAWIRELYPERRGYLDVYDHYKQLGPRSIYGHGIWLSEAEMHRCHDTGTALAHCPTSNEFLGSGQFNLHNALKASRPVRVGLGTDLGAGTSFSQLQTLNQAYKTAQVLGNSLSAPLAFYLATRGGARALCLEDKVGSLAPGMEADVLVMDLKSTPAIEFRLRNLQQLRRNAVRADDPGRRPRDPRDLDRGKTGAHPGLSIRYWSTRARSRSNPAPSPRHALPCMQASVAGFSRASRSSIGLVCGACA